MKGAVVFDLDGTLVDSAPDIAAAANRMLAEMDQAPLPLPVLTGFIGHGIPNLVRRVQEACEIDPACLPAMTARMLAQYEASPAALTRPYPGVPQTLRALAEAGHPLAVCTNKLRGLSERILEALDLGQYFQAVIGGDSLPQKKPDPAPLHAAFAALAAPPLLYVGDSEVDAQTARAAGRAFALFTGGYRQTPVAELPHLLAFERFEALRGFVLSH